MEKGRRFHLGPVQGIRTWSERQHKMVDVLNDTNIHLACMHQMEGKTTAVCGLVTTFMKEAEKGEYNILLISDCARNACGNISLIRDMFNDDASLVHANCDAICTKNVSVKSVPINERALRGMSVDLLIVDNWECMSFREKRLIEPLLDLENIKVLLVSRTIEHCQGGAN